MHRFSAIEEQAPKLLSYAELQRLSEEQSPLSKKAQQEAPAQHDAESAARSFCNQFLYAFVVWHFSGLTFSSWVSERLVHAHSTLSKRMVRTPLVPPRNHATVYWRCIDLSVIVRVHLPLGVSFQPKQIVSLIVYVNLHFAATFNTNYRSRKKPCRPKELHWVSSSAISAAGIRLSKGATYMIPFSTKHYACSPLMLTFHRLISIIKQKSTPPFRSPQSSQTPTASEKNEMKQEFQALKKTFVEFQLNFDAKLDAKLKVTI